MRVLPYEGSWEGHDLFVRANLRLALLALKEGRFDDCLRSVEASKEFPEYLGTGKPWEPDMRMQDYLTFHMLRKQGSNDVARAMLDRVLQYTEKHRLGWGTEHMIGLIAMEEAGRIAEADALAREWQTLSPEEPQLQWWLARRKHDDGLAGRLLRNAGSDPRLALRLEIAAW
jgi:hypothetical protein